MKREEQVGRYRDKFITGASEKGLGTEQAKQLFAEMEENAAFAFSRAHAYTFTHVSYVCAWLKVHC